MSIYAIYHLLRSATYRSASTSSSYHFFALVIDACLLPFYIWIFLLARLELTDNLTDDERWTSIFAATSATEKLILATWLLAIILASIHGLALLISTYLSITFRSIARLPPDMNPLEAHLTSRPRKSQVKVFKEQKEVVDQPRPIHFLQTRSSKTAPATLSRLNLTLPPLPQGEKSISDRVLGTQSVSKRGGNSRYNFPSIRNILKGSSMYTLNLYEDYITPPVPRRSSKRQSQYSGGMSSRDASPQRDGAMNQRMSGEENLNLEVEAHPRSALDFTPSTNHGNSRYQAIPQSLPNPSNVYAQPDLLKTHNTKHLRPLHMNPPTPPPITTSAGNVRVTSPNIPPRSPSRKPYGDLAARPSSDLGIPSSIHETNATPWYSPARAPPRPPNQSEGRVLSRSGADIADAGMPFQESSNPYLSEREQVHDGSSDASSGLGYKGASGVLVNGLRGRNVSGKVAEEGRGGPDGFGGGDLQDQTGDVGTGRNTSSSWSVRWLGGRGW